MSERRAKRRNTRAARPIDKKLICVSHTTMDATQKETVLMTATFPCTLVGLRWSLACVQDAGASNSQYVWSIVISRDGKSPSALALGDTNEMYTPEQDVLAFGAGVQTGSDLGDAQMFNSATKSMRKLQAGDTLQFIAKGTATNTTAIHGIIQFFCKS